MAMIIFDKERAIEWRQLILKLAHEVEERELRLNALINGIDMEIVVRDEIETRTDSLRKTMRGLREGLEVMAGFLARAESDYTNADSKIAGLIRQLTQEWVEAERKLAPVLSRSKIGLSVEDVDRIKAVHALDGLFMSGAHMDFENNTAYFKPLGVKFEVLPDDIEE